MQDRRLAISEIELANAEQRAGLNAEPSRVQGIKSCYRLYRRLIGIVTAVLLLILICFEAPRMMKDNLDVCLAQYAADSKISTEALSTDLSYQPEFIEAISLCSEINP